MNNGWRDNFNGTTMIYRMSPGDDIDCSQCDYDVRMQSESKPKDARAMLTEARKRRKTRKLRCEELQNELLVVLGPGMSAIDAVDQLERLIKTFKKEGMLCGRDGTGKYVAETIDGRRFQS